MRPLGFFRVYRTYAPFRSLSDSGYLLHTARNLFDFFRGQPLKAAPVGVVWELTYDCNCRCASCATHRVRRLRGDLPPAETLQVARKIGNAGVRFVSLSGGEPLLSQSFFPVVEALKNRGVKVLLSTNGSLLEEMACRIATNRFHSVTVSLDSVDPERHDAMRGHPGLSRKVERGLAALKRESAGADTLIRLRFLVTPHNFKEMVPFVDSWQSRVDDICFQPAQDISEAHVHDLQDKGLRFGPEHRQAFAAQVKRLIARYPAYDTPYYRGMTPFLFDPDAIRDRFFCLLPALGLKVTANGEAVTCADASVALGDLREDEMREVWNHANLRVLREKCRLRRRDCLCWMQPTQISSSLPRWLSGLWRRSQ